MKRKIVLRGLYKYTEHEIDVREDSVEAIIEAIEENYDLLMQGQERCPRGYIYVYYVSDTYTPPIAEGSIWWGGLQGGHRIDLKMIEYDWNK